MKTQENERKITTNLNVRTRRYESKYCPHVTEEFPEGIQLPGSFSTHEQAHRYAKRIVNYLTNNGTNH